jgi:hypothetical protein
MSRSIFLLLFSVLLLACSACRQQEETADDRSVQEEVDAIPVMEDEAGPSVTLEEPMMLNYRFSKGERFGYRISKDEQVTMLQDSVAEDKHQVVTYWYTFTVLDAFDIGGARLLAECDRVQFSGTYNSPAGKREMTYDSDADNPHEIEKLYTQYNAPVNSPFEVLVAPDGRIADIDNLDEVIRNYLKDDYATTKKDQLELIKQDYAETGLFNVLQMMFQKLPETQVSVDSTWTLVRPERFGYLSIRNEAVYAVKDITRTSNGDLVHITARITSTYTGKKTVDTGQGMATMSDFDVKGSGRSSYNLQKGRIHRRELRNRIFVKMFIELPAELKRLAPDQKDFWWTQRATVVDTIEPWTR